MSVETKVKPVVYDLLLHKNAFGFWRLSLALLVIVSHSFILSGTSYEPLLALSKGELTLGSLAVGGFFVIRALVKITYVFDVGIFTMM